MVSYEVRAGVNKTIAQLVSWSLSCFATGTYPDRGFYGEVFDKNSFRHGYIGKPIAGGYKSPVLTWLFFGFI